MKVRFVFVGEGPSDEGLVRLLQNLCLRQGATEAIGIPLDWRRLDNRPRRDTKNKLHRALAVEPTANLAFVHRDADSRDEGGRLREIQVAAAGTTVPVIPVIPVQQTEAWLLLDERAIRTIVRNPKGSERLDLPGPMQVERLANPKETLRRALLLASGQKGRRRRLLDNQFGRLRSGLLSGLSMDGALREVPAWRRVMRRTSDALRRLSDSTAR